MKINQDSETNLCFLENTHERWMKELNEQGMLYLYAMTGYGKTIQAQLFANNYFKEWERLSALEDTFWVQLDEWASSSKKMRVKTLLILDDLQWVFDEEKRQLLFDKFLQLRRIPKLYIFLISRAELPSYLIPLQVTRQLVVENSTSLQFTANEARNLMLTYQGLAVLTPERQELLVQRSIELTKGYPLGVNALFQRLEAKPEDPDMASVLATRDMYDYFSIHLFGHWTKSRIEAAILLSVFDTFDLEMARLILGQGVENVLKDFLEVGSFLQRQTSETYRILPFFKRYLEEQLKKRPQVEWEGLYAKAASCYEERRMYKQALSCWKQADRNDKIIDIVVYLSENAEGCIFAQIANEYVEDLSEDWEEREPRVLGAKAMLAAYRMQTEECMTYMERLRNMAEADRKCVMKSNALAVYVRTVIACPYDTADQLKDNLLKYVDYVRQNGAHLQNIMPTGNMPSLLNGGLDLLAWEPKKKLIYPVMKVVAEAIMGNEAVGIADAAMGEAYYEQNQSSKAMSYLTRALSDANYKKGSIRVQYAVTAIMTRVFQSEGQQKTSEEILENIRRKAEQENYLELLPNVRATQIQGGLLQQDMLACDDWLDKEAPDEFALFYITMRYQLLVKARVYVTKGKNMEALYILNLLENYARKYQRTYFLIEVLVLKAIILYRRDEEWQDELLEAAELSKPYRLVRIFADQGAALLPLWTQVDWKVPKELLPKSAIILREMKHMASLYPHYLQIPQRFETLSAKEQEVLGFIGAGYSNSQIAEQLNLNLGTVKFHASNIMKKLNAENRTVAVKIAQEEGLL